MSEQKTDVADADATTGIANSISVPAVAADTAGVKNEEQCELTATDLVAIGDNTVLAPPPTATTTTTTAAITTSTTTGNINEQPNDMMDTDRTAVVVESAAELPIPSPSTTQDVDEEQEPVQKKLKLDMDTPVCEQGIATNIEQIPEATSSSSSTTATATTPNEETLVKVDAMRTSSNNTSTTETIPPHQEPTKETQGVTEKAVKVDAMITSNSTSTMETLPPHQEPAKETQAVTKTSAKIDAMITSNITSTTEGIPPHQEPTKETQGVVENAAKVDAMITSNSTSTTETISSRQEPAKEAREVAIKKEVGDDDDDDDLFGDERIEAEKKDMTVTQSNTNESSSEAVTEAADKMLVKESSKTITVVSLKADAPVVIASKPEEDSSANTAAAAASTDTTKKELVDDSTTSSNKIPRKERNLGTAKPSASSIGSSPVASLSKSNDSKTPGKSYGLPIGVHVPASIVRTRLLDTEMNTPGSKLMDVLKSLPVNLINDALTEYDDAVEIKGATAIRNHGAYLYGVVKRYVSVHERAVSGEGTGILPMGEDGLTAQVNSRLDQLVSSGFCTSQEMNEKVKSKIRMLSEKDALFALDELSSVDRSSIRNFGSYFMGILNRYMRGDHASKIRPQGPKSGGASYQHHRENDRFPRDNPGNPHFNSGNNRENRFQSGNSNNRGNTFAKNRNMPQSSQFVPHMGGGMNQHPMMGGLNPSGMNHQMGMPTGMPSPHQSNFPPQQQAPSYLSQQNQQQGMYQQSSQHLGMGNYNQNGNYSQNPQQGMFQQQPQQQNSFGVQSQSAYANNQHTPIPPSNSYGQQQLSGYSQPSSQPPYQGNQQPFGQVQPFASNQMGSQAPFLSQQQHHVQSQVGEWNPHQQHHQGGSQGISPAIDILGLADKAASAIQALGGSTARNNLVNQADIRQPGYQQPLQQNQASYPQYGSGGLISSNQPPQGAQMIQQQQQYPPPLQQQQQLFAPQQSNMNQSVAAQASLQAGRRRTTAQLPELPPSVQYAVQSLITTGAVNGPLDEGILGMIIDLPEQLALTAIQKFAMIDKSTMRNRTAYLAGVLRRELEKIRRR